MCMLCMDPKNSPDDLAKLVKQHKMERVKQTAIRLKELIGDCRKILSIHESAGTSDPETKRLLDRLVKAQYELSHEM